MSDSVRQAAETIREALEAARARAWGNYAHLCNGLCPDIDPPGPDSRDPECEQCQIMVAIDAALAALAVLENAAKRGDCGGVNCGRCQQCLTAQALQLAPIVMREIQRLIHAGHLDAAITTADEYARAALAAATPNTPQDERWRYYTGTNNQRADADKAASAAPEEDDE